MYNSELFHEETLANVERFYKENDNPEFDITPALICADEKKVYIYAMPDAASPPELAAKALEKHTEEYGAPEEVAFIAASWLRDPVSGEVVGEGVSVRFETTVGTRHVFYLVKRDPLPRLTPAEEPEAAIDRVPLLYNPSVTLN